MKRVCLYILILLICGTVTAKDFSNPTARVKDSVEKVINILKNECDKNGVKFLETGTLENIIEVIDSGARVIAGQNQEAAKIGRRHTNRKMKV